MPVTWSFSEVPIDEGFERLLRDVSSLLLYGPAEDGAPRRLLAVHTFRHSTDQVDSYTRVGEEGKRVRAVRLLAHRPEADDLEYLALLLSDDEDPVVRRLAVSGLAQLRDEEAREALQEALWDDDSVVRSRAILGLGRTWGGAVVEQLGDVLFDDPDPSVRRQAALQLGQIQSEEAYEALSTARFDPDDSVRQAIFAGLSRLAKIR